MDILIDLAIPLLEKDKSIMGTSKKFIASFFCDWKTKERKSSLHVTKSNEYHYALIILDSSEVFNTVVIKMVTLIVLSHHPLWLLFLSPLWVIFIQ